MYTYIVVDDEPLTRRGTIKKISSLNDTVKCVGEASNGKEGLELIEALNPDIVITDMNMPVLDGTGFLQQINAQYPDKQIIVISGYKDFEYAKQAVSARAISYILKPFNRETIHLAIQDAINHIENSTEIQNKIVSVEAEREYAKYDYDIQSLKNLILGYHTTPLELVSAKLKMIEKNHHFILMTLHSEKPLDESEIKNLMLENGFGDLYLYLPHLYNDKIGFLILFFPEKTPLQLPSLCKQLSLDLINLFSYENQKVSIGISHTRSDLLQLNNTFNETVQALNSKKISDNSCYYFFTTHNEPIKTISWEKESEFLFRIEAGETQRVTELIKDLFENIATEELYTLYDIKNYCIGLAEKARAILKLYFEGISQNSQSSSIQTIFNTMFSFEEIQEYFLQVFTNISMSMESRSIYANGDIVENIMTYVKRSYSNNITLEFVSSLFYMNRSYCSHLFKKKTGKNFVDYVNAIRIEEAKLLLSQSDKKLYHISKAVGYDNVKYFFRVFKKLTGVTPEQYRKV